MQALESWNILEFEMNMFQALRGLEILYLYKVMEMCWHFEIRSPQNMYMCVCVRMHASQSVDGSTIMCQLLEHPVGN